MRIEINAGGLGAGLAVAEFQSNMSGLVSNVENVISSFKAVTNKTYNLSGGVGNLQDALDEISVRVQDEVEKLTAATQVQKKANDFLSLAMQVDKQVAQQVNRNKERFFTKYPRLQPQSASKEDEDWCDQAWDWLCGVGENIAEGAKAAWDWTKDAASKAWDWTKDTAKKAWDSLVEFYNENKRLCQILIGVAAIAVAVVVTVATGGAAVPALLAMTKTAIIGGLASAAISGSITAITSLASGESLEDTLDATLNSAADGFCSGFMWGGIFAAGSQIVSVAKTASAGTSAVSNTKIPGEKQYTSIDDIPQKEYNCISKYNSDPASFNDPIRAGTTTKDTRQLSNIIKNHKLTSGKTLYRRASFKDLNGLNVSNPNSLIGQKYSFKGFMSTTPNVGLANSVSHGNVVFEFSASAGTNALDLSALMYNEVIFDNPLCRIDNIQKLSSGVTKIFATIL